MDSSSLASSGIKTTQCVREHLVTICDTSSFKRICLHTLLIRRIHTEGVVIYAWNKFMRII